MPGLLGVAGGVIYVPLLTVIAKLDQKHAVGTSIALVFIGVLFTVAQKALTQSAGNPKLHLGIILSLLILSPFGVRIGASLCKKLKPTTIRILFSLVLMISAAGMIIKSFSA